MAEGSAPLAGETTDQEAARFACRAGAKSRAEAQIAAADEARRAGTITESGWQRRVTDALAAAYLIEDDPRWQSGFDGDADLWRQARELVLEAVDRDGSFLDVGCATGHLMECLAAWGAERGVQLTVFGLELSPDLARAARQRLPDWAERIVEGNVVDWNAPRRFTYVRTGLEYVSAYRRAPLIGRLLRDLVEPGGRLIVGPVAEPELEDARRAFTLAGISEVVEVSARDRTGKIRFILATR
jgi:SAM-dependent methyltransferase